MRVKRYGISLIYYMIIRLSHITSVTIKTKRNWVKFRYFDDFTLNELVWSWSYFYAKSVLIRLFLSFSFMISNSKTDSEFEVEWNFVWKSQLCCDLVWWVIWGYTPTWRREMTSVSSLALAAKTEITRLAYSMWSAVKEGAIWCIII